MINLLIVGIGNIGKRHLEASLKSEYVEMVYIYDTNKSLYEDLEYPNSDKIIKLSTLSNLNQKINGLIIATSSKNREIIFVDLFRVLKLDFVILEKVLFQTIKSYYDVLEIIYGSGTKVYVNCPARLMNSYISLKKELKDQKIIKFDVTGGNWFLASNAIHFIDLIDFLVSDTKYLNIDLEPNFIDGNFYNKRQGYVEFFGDISGTVAGVDFRLSCDQSDNPYIISIETDYYHYQIDETNGNIKRGYKDGKDLIELDFPIEYVSDLTTKALNNWAQKGDTGLISINRSSKFHIELISAFLKHLNKNKLQVTDICPIT